LSPGDVNPATNNIATDATPQGENTDEIKDPAHDSSNEAEPAARDGYQETYQKVLDAIETDPKLSKAVAKMEEAGDRDFRNRLATTITNLWYDRPAALDAIRGEVFASQMRYRGGVPSGAAAIAALHTLNIVDRLAWLLPGVGIAEAGDRGFRAAVNTEKDQQRLYWSIVNNSTADSKLFSCHAGKKPSNDRRLGIRSHPRFRPEMR
jgi:hypothetical protein